MNALAGFLFSPPDKKDAAIQGWLAACRKYHGLVEANLVNHGGKFAASNEVTIADFVMASYIGNYLTNANFPLVQQSMATVEETPRFKAYI